MRTLARALAELLLPPGCARCGGEIGQAPEASPFCRRCEPVWTAPDPAPPPRPLRAWSAAVPYTGEWREWIRRFKYPQPGLRGLDPAADAVVLALARRAARQVPDQFAPEAVVPVPLHRDRRRERGFDQAVLLARAVARAQGLVAPHHALVRLRPTPRQTDLSRRERRRNLRGAFAPRQRLSGCVWLVDDVTTTGSTLTAAARALRRAGARRVVGVCVARTPAGEPLPEPADPALESPREAG